GPVRHTVRLVESHGTIVLRAFGKAGPVDACSVAFPDHPCIVLQTWEGDALRTRYDVAHELGHLVMHTNAVGDARALEQQADRFAAAFLTRERDIRASLRGAREIDAFLRLRQQWGVSMQALLRRSVDLQMLNK